MNHINLGSGAFRERSFQGLVKGGLAKTKKKERKNPYSICGGGEKGKDGWVGGKKVCPSKPKGTRFWTTMEGGERPGKKFCP